MVIEDLELADFRNVVSRKLAFSAHNVFFLGPNGSGKTNLLESIAFLSLLRSFRTTQVRELVRLGAHCFHLGAHIRTAAGREYLRVSEELSGKRELFIGSAPVRRSSEFIREFHAVVFSPEDRMIASGSSGSRRKFFDILISTIEPEYLLRLSRYTRALMQRNKALKCASRAAAAFEGELAEHAPFIAERRRFYADAAAGEVNRLLNTRGEVAIHCKGDAPATPEEFRELLASRRESELRRACTLAGPQLDEFEIVFNGKPLRAFGSTGQIRLVTLLMKLAQFNLVRRGTAAPVAVLADDVTGELDRENLDLFLETISGAGHCFFTFAEAPRFTLPDAETIRVDAPQGV